MSDDKQLRPDWWFRLLRFGIWLLSVIILVVVAILAVTGHQFNFKKATLEMVGMIQFRPTPSGSKVFVNDEQLNWWSNSRAHVAGGNYQLRVEHDGYLPWQKTTSVQVGNVYWHYPRLIPAMKQIEAVKSYPQIRASYASPDRRYLLNYLEPNLFELVDLKSNQPNYQTVNLTEFVTDAAGRDLVFFDWIESTDQLLFRDQNSDELFLVLPKDKLATVNLTKWFTESGLKFDSLQVVDGSKQIVYGLSDHSLWRFSLTKNDLPARLLGQVLDVKAIKDDLLAVVQAAPEGAGFQARILIYDYASNQTYEVDRVPAGQSYFIEAYRYGDGRDYLVYGINQYLRVVRGDFKSLKQLKQVSLDEPLAGLIDSPVWQAFQAKNPSIEFKNLKLPDVPSQVAVASLGRFLLLRLPDEDLSPESYLQLVQSMQLVDNESIFSPTTLDITSPPVARQRWWVYDIDYQKYYTTLVQAGGGSLRSSKGANTPRWLDDCNMWENIAGVVRIKEFDGQNQHKLVPALANLDIQLTPNGRFVYFFNQKPGQSEIVLYRLQMTDL